jgi:hypothetical protein
VRCVDRPQRKQLAVYQVAGESFAKVDIPLIEVPGREKDEELIGAVLGMNTHTEPVRWAKRDVLILERHEYYQKIRPASVEGVKSNESHSFDRLYQITATISRTEKLRWFGSVLGSEKMKEPSDGEGWAAQRSQSVTCERDLE